MIYLILSSQLHLGYPPGGENEAKQENRANRVYYIVLFTGGDNKLFYVKLAILKCYVFSIYLVMNWIFFLRIQCLVSSADSASGPLK